MQRTCKSTNLFRMGSDVSFKERKKRNKCRVIVLMMEWFNVDLAIWHGAILDSITFVEIEQFAHTGRYCRLISSGEL